MKLFKTTALMLAVALLTTQCGLNDKEKASLLHEQQVKDDSVRIAQINHIKDREALRSNLSDSLASHTALLNRQQNFLIQLRTSIYAANDQMTQIKAFHFGRLPADRDIQIRNQEQAIQTLLLQEQNVQEVIQHTKEDIEQLKAELKSGQ